jgi:soluble lytic murein transglycosylase-like protein
VRSLVLLSLLLLGTSALGCSSTPDPALLDLAGLYAEGFGLDERFVQALVWVESGFCPTAVSPKGAVGLGQLMPGTAALLGVNPWDPAQNLWATAKYLREQYDTFGDWKLALAAYNAGPGNVIKYRGVPPFTETRSYIRRVLSVYRNYRAIQD